jgi:predicted nucleic acid-binding protein
VTSRFVIDASAVVAMTTNRPPRPDLLKRVVLGKATAPEVLDLEVLHALRNRVTRAEISMETDGLAVEALPDLPISRVQHRVLIGRVWELRHSVTAYDAAYVALAERLGVPLVTCDAKLARSNGHRAEIELYPRS